MIIVESSGPVFDGRAAAAMEAGTLAVRHELANDVERKVRQNFLGSIRDDRGVFLGTITTTDVTRTYVFGGAWTRDTDRLGGGTQEIHRTYTLPIVVEDPVTDTIVTTGDAMYGPWLEGTGSRNRTTRFKGYFGFRRASDEIQLSVERIAEVTLQPFTARCNE